MFKDIQALRFFAIFFVIFLHLAIILPDNHTYGILRSFSNTDSGVELFFVIAGFFLSHTLEKTEDITSKSDKIVYLLKLYIKKLKRLSPPVYFWIFIPLIFSIITRNSDLWLPYNLMIEKFFSSIVWLRNFEEIGTEGNFGYMWALSLEMQFFIVYPLLFLMLGRKKTILISVVLCLMMTFYRPFGGPAWMFRFDPMLYGALLYYLVKSFDLNKLANEEFKINKLHKIIISLTLIISLAVIPAALSHVWTFRFSCASFLSSICVLLAVMEINFFTSFPDRINKVIYYIGDRSFSLFCCHIPVWFMVFQFSQGHQIPALYRVITQVILMFVFAELTYRFLEKPFKKS